MCPDFLLPGKWILPYFVHVRMYWLTWHLFQIFEFLSGPIHGGHRGEILPELGDDVIISPSLCSSSRVFLWWLWMISSLILCRGSCQSYCRLVWLCLTNLWIWRGLHHRILLYPTNKGIVLPCLVGNVSSLCMHPSGIAAPLEWNLKNRDWFSASCMIDLLTVSLAIVLLNAGEENVGGEYLLLYPSLKWACCLSPRRKIRIIIHLFTSGSSTCLFSMLGSVWTSIEFDFVPFPSIWEKGVLLNIAMGGSSLISGHQCQLFASSTSF